MLPEDLCEACRREAVQVVVTEDDPEQPYRLCSGCERRIRSLSLRPLEWFNLASVHGPSKHLLHDDFYWDNGVAQQPDEDVVEPERYPAPTPESAKDDPARLIDCAVSSSAVGEDDAVIRYLTRYDRLASLRSLQRRVAEHTNADVEATAYDLCAYVLRSAAADWIRSRWDSFRPETFFNLGRASAYCLPPDEAFQRVTQGLEHRAGHPLDFACHALAYFHSGRVLDWIEAHPTFAHADTLGHLAALNGFSWTRAARWLEQGRPLSLVALSALQACFRYDTAQLKKRRPVLENPAPVAEMIAVLDAYLQQDAVPNVRRRVDFLREQFHRGPADAW